MSGESLKAPATFAVAQKKRSVESHQAMTKALRELRFEDALEHARTALALEPNNAMTKEFIRLLEEKQELAETDDDSEGEVATSGPTGAAASDDESEDDDDDTDEGEADEEGSEESEESVEDDPAVLRALERLQLAEPRNPGQAQPQEISAAKRYAMRASLRAGIKELLLAELAKEMAADDLLLRT